ncbi:MAG: hypothetical protein U1D96_02885 [Eubacteriales bacterium]|jgi:hypothetical protein|nr:hypothetical protein [Bacillota bacterium]MBV1728402.1 hypothetical protein [Desulforudis sp.]MDQ7789377.1 hypothetical protein [Clostridia bacterium]MDZ4042423.1 hypothetical protein [Eubacteriales bacterium]MBV1735344.1 hypothetical protein [Desulforudis sp.]
MITNKAVFFKGIVSMALFLLLLVPLFTPVFSGQTGMEAADDLFNSLSKGSSYYIPVVAEEAPRFEGQQVSAKIKAADVVQSEMLVKLFEGAGASVTAGPEAIEVTGDLGAILNAAIVDADDLFNQREAAIESRYGVDNARAVLYYWYDASKQIQKSLGEEHKFEQSLFVKKVSERAIEPAYNFAGIAPSKVSERAGITVFLLVFYVFYTIWYGFSIMFIFEGLGISVSKH